MGGGGSKKVKYKAPKIPKDTSFQEYLKYQKEREAIATSVLRLNVQNKKRKKKRGVHLLNLLLVVYVLVLKHSCVKV